MADQSKIDTIKSIQRKSAVTVQNGYGLPPAIDGVNFSAIPPADLKRMQEQLIINRDRANNVTISQGEASTRDKARAFITGIPVVGQSFAKNVFDPLFGNGAYWGQRPDGTLIEDNGEIGKALNFFRPFGIGKTNNQKFVDRYDPLVAIGTDPQRAQEIASTYILTSDNFADRMNERVQKDQFRKDLNLTDEEKKAIRGANISETIDNVFGALDFVSAGTTKGIRIGATTLTKDLLERLARDTSETAIERTLLEITPKFEGAKVTPELVSFLKNTDNVKDVGKAVTMGLEDLSKEVAQKQVAEVTAKVEAKQASRSAEVKAVDEALPSPTATDVAKQGDFVDNVTPSVGKGSEDLVAPIVRTAEQTPTPNAEIVKQLEQDVAQVTKNVDSLTNKIKVAYQSVGRNADLPEFYEADKVLSDIFNEMDLAEAGQRGAYVYEDGYGTIDRILSKQSTFPQWVPEDLRRKDLFQKVFGGLDLNNLKYPVGNRPAQRRLYDAILSEADARLGVDTSAIRSDILKAYEKGNTTIPSGGRAQGGSAVAGGAERTGATTGGERVATGATSNETLAEATIANTQEIPTASSPLLKQNQVDPLEQAGQRTADSVEASSLQSYDITKVYDNKGETVEQFRMFDIEEGIDFTVTDSKQLLATLRQDIPDPTNYKDISGFKGQARDIWRNTERVFGNDYEVVKKTILDPFDDAKGALVRNRAQILTEFDEKIVTGLGIKKGSKESRAVMDYGEKMIGKEELVKQFGSKRANDIIEASQWFRQKYDAMLDEVNAIRATIYPRSPEKLIPRRQDYFRHFRDLSSGWSGLANIFETSAGIDPRLSGISPFTKPKSKFLSFAQQRLGNKSERDAVGGFLDYVEPFVYAKHIDPHVNDFRILAKSLADRTAETKNLNNYIESLHDYANDLAGKTNPADRYIQKVIPYGRKTFRALDWANSRVKANTIVANISSTIAQIFNVPQGIGSAKHHSVNGAIRTISDIWNENKAMKQSIFVNERYGQSVYNKFNVGMLENTKAFAGWMTGVLDEVGTKFIWNAHYEKAIREGIEEPIRYADDITRKLVAGRGIGEVPLLQKSKVFQLVAPFQLEVANLWWVMGDFVRKDKNGRRNLSALVTTFVAMYVMNDVAERLRGSDVGFDPINAIWEGYKIASTEEEIDDKILKFGGRVSGEVLSNVPLGQTIASAYPEYGTNIGGTQLPTRSDLFGEGDPTRFGSGLLVVKGLQDPFFKLVPAYGGNQIKKTLQGAEALMNEDVTDKNGKILYSVERDIPTTLRVMLFGKYSTPEAREYFNQPKLKQQAEAEMRTLYRVNRDLIESGQQGLAQSNVDELSDEAYDMYKKVKKEEETKAEEKAVEAMMSTVRQTRAMLDGGNEKEAQAVVDAMSDEEYAIYEKAKKKLTEGAKIEQTEQDILGTVFTYAQAIGVDPVTAFDRIFSGDRIRRVDNRTIIVERLPLSESAQIKADRGATGDMRLDHTMPLQLGGSNSPDNLKLVSFAEWESYTPVENHLGKLLRDDKIEKREAQDLIIKFKNGEISAEEILAMQ